MARSDADGVALDLTTTARVVFSDTVLYVLNDGTFFRGREIASTLRLAGDEIVSVDLPRMAENANDAFKDRTFTLLVLSRQIR